MRLIDLDDDRNCYCGMDGEYENWNIDPDVLPSTQPERLTDDDFETIRIHLNAIKEKLCNQRRWEEANEYQRIIDRFMAFASAQPKISRIEQELHGKTPEEQYDFIYWLLLKFGLAYTDSRLAVVEWLRGEKEDG